MPFGNIKLRRVAITLAITAVITGAGLSWYASADPDGLEWSILRITGAAELDAKGGVYDAASDIQKKTSVFPGYKLKTNGSGKDKAEASEASGQSAPSGEAAPSGGSALSGETMSSKAGISLSGLAGGVLSLLLASLAGVLIRVFKKIKGISPNKYRYSLNG
jgi:cobalt/nickel transport system permease protein